VHSSQRQHRDLPFGVDFLRLFPAVLTYLSSHLCDQVVHFPIIAGVGDVLSAISRKLGFEARRLFTLEGNVCFQGCFVWSMPRHARFLILTHWFSDFVDVRDCLSVERLTSASIIGWQCHFAAVSCFSRRVSESRA
jgi:hypothetical protein